MLVPRAFTGLTLALAALATASLHAADVKENWSRHCSRCHGQDGAGQTKAGQKLKVRDYTTAEAQDKMKEPEMLAAILDGVKDADGKERMAAYREKLTEAEAKDLVAFVRTLRK